MLALRVLEVREPLTIRTLVHVDHLTAARKHVLIRSVGDVGAYEVGPLYFDKLIVV